MLAIMAWLSENRDAPFAHAGERLHQWMFATRWWHELVGVTHVTFTRSGA
jgi:hypothetical protein